MMKIRHSAVLLIPLLLGISACAVQKDIPLWRNQHYMRAWNRYVRDPSNNSDVLADDHVPTATRELRYGKTCWPPSDRLVRRKSRDR